MGTTQFWDGQQGTLLNTFHSHQLNADVLGISLFLLQQCFFLFLWYQYIYLPLFLSFYLSPSSYLSSVYLFSPSLLLIYLPLSLTSSCFLICFHCFLSHHLPVSHYLTYLLFSSCNSHSRPQSILCGCRYQGYVLGGVGVGWKMWQRK